MATFYVRNVPDELYEQLQELAKAENRSINAQVITLLKNALPAKTAQPQSETAKSITEILAESRRRRRVNPADFGMPDSTHRQKFLSQTCFT
jgi:hypothetical protein